jgi:tetratricopeptide (TPR) repeat protein
MQSTGLKAVIFKIVLALLLAAALQPYFLPDRYGTVTGPGTDPVMLSPRQAYRVYRQALAYSPWRGDLWELAGLAAWDSAQKEDAGDCLLQALALGRLTARGEAVLAEVFLVSGDGYSALGAWRKALAQGGDPAVLIPRMLSAAKGAGLTASAVQIAQSWSGWTKTDAPVLYDLGVNISYRQPEAALQLLGAAANLDPIYANSGLFLQNGIHAALLQSEPAYRSVTIGQALTGIGAWGAAANAFADAVRQAPEYAEAWALLGEAREHEKQDGLPALQRAAALKPDSILVQVFQAYYWRRHGKADLALVYLHSVVEQDPSNAMWQVELGYTLVEMGDLVSALPYFERAVEAAPTDPYYWRALAVFCIQNDVQVQETGLPAARQAAALADNDPQNLDVLGQAFLQLGDAVTGQRFFQKAVDLDNQFGLGYYHLGQAYLQLAQPQAARQALLQVIALKADPALMDLAQRLLKQTIP